MQMRTSPPIERVRHNILFGGLDDGMFATLRTKLQERCYSVDEIIVEDDTEGDELYLLVEGRVKILKQTKFGDEKLLALLHPGDFFGDLELVDGRPRSARVVAADDCLTYVLHKSEFDRLLKESHGFAVRLMEVLSVRLRALNNHFVSELERNAAHTIAEVRKLEQLIESTKVVNSTLELDKLLNLILETALKIVDGDRGTLYLIDEARQILWSKIFKGSEQIRIELPIGKGIAGYVAATGDTLNIPDAYLDPRFNPDFDRRTGYRTRSILCIPMRDKDGRIIGVFQLLNKRKGVFTTDDESFIDALSLHAAIAIENARLYELERRRVMMEKELFAAREVQMSLIPRQLPVMENFEFAARTIPAQEVGGDLFDFIRLDDRRLEVVVADVAGKGLPAALLATLTKGVLFSQSMQGHSPQTHLKGSNRIVRSNFPRKAFITALLTQLDSSARTVTIANAGHCFPLLYRGRERRVSVIPVRGMALNFGDSILCEERTVQMEKGDALVMYSDGVSEAEDKNAEMFGVERLQGVVERYGDETAQHLMERIHAEVELFAGGVAQHDDITIVVMKALGMNGKNGE